MLLLLIKVAQSCNANKRQIVDTLHTHCTNVAHTLYVYAAHEQSASRVWCVREREREKEREKERERKREREREKESVERENERERRERE